MDGGHEGLLDAELLVDDIGERGQTVRRAAGVGDNAHVRAVLVAVDAEDKGRSRVVLGGRGEDNLLRAALEVAAGLVGGVVGAGGLDDVLRAALAPVDHRGIGLAVDLDVAAVDDEVAAGVLHGAGEVAEHGVVLEQIDHIVDVCLAQVHAADLKLLRALRQNAQDDASDTTEAVDTDFDHKTNFLPFFKNIFLPPEAVSL